MRSKAAAVGSWDPGARGGALAPTFCARASSTASSFKRSMYSLAWGSSACGRERDWAVEKTASFLQACRFHLIARAAYAAQRRP